MTLYVGSPKESTKKLLELTNEFSKATGYKINTPKNNCLNNLNNQ